MDTYSNPFQSRRTLPAGVLARCPERYGHRALLQARRPGAADVLTSSIEVTVAGPLRSRTGFLRRTASMMSYGRSLVSSWRDRGDRGDRHRRRRLGVARRAGAASGAGSPAGAGRATSSRSPAAASRSGTSHLAVKSAGGAAAIGPRP